MSTNTIAISEKRNQRKGMTFSIVFNSIIVLLALFPFLTQNPPEPEPPQFVEIQFTDFKSSSQKSAEGDMKEKEAPQKKVEEAVEEEVVEETVPEPVVEAEPTPEPEVKPEPTPQRAPIVTTPKPNPPVRTAPDNKKKEKMKVPPVRNKRKTKTHEPKPSTPKKTTPKKKTKVNNKKKNTGKTSSKKQEGKNNKSNSGGGEAPENGKDATTGKTNTGTTVGDFPGDGLFNRKVVYRADVKSVTKEEGKIVIDLCVNRDGRVVYSKFNKSASTIKTMSVIRKALSVAQQYRFERDYTAPDKQCGKLTFIFEIEEE